MKTLNRYMPLILIASIICGGIAGYVFGFKMLALKPLGDIFLNLILTAVVPLIFFSVSSAIAKTGSLNKLGKLFSTMFIVFLITGTIAAVYALITVKLFPIDDAANILLGIPSASPNSHFTFHLASMFSVSDFPKILSHENILALIIFSIIIGFAASTSKEHGKPFVTFLQSGEYVFMRVMAIIMLFAPIGFFAFFSVLISQIGPNLMEHYAKISLVYYISAAIYFAAAYSIFAYLAGGHRGIKSFWQNIYLPMTTAIATCSSAASIPANLTAAKEIGVAPEIYEAVIPIGTVMHKDGSIIGAIFKIAFLFAIFKLSFSSLPVILTAIGVALLVGTVMGAIPSGGMLGELLILSVYGFPASALFAIVAFSIIIDPIATMLNVTGNTAGTMLIARVLNGKKWPHRSN